MLGQNLQVSEIENGTIEKFYPYTVRIKFMHGDGNAETLEDKWFYALPNALEWYALWTGIKKLKRNWNHYAAQTAYIMETITRERAFMGDCPEYFERVENSAAYADRYQERLEMIEDRLMDIIPYDNQSRGQAMADCKDVTLLFFDKEKSERREMKVK